MTGSTLFPHVRMRREPFKFSHHNMSTLSCCPMTLMCVFFDPMRSCPWETSTARRGSRMALDETGWKGGTYVLRLRL